MNQRRAWRRARFGRRLTASSRAVHRSSGPSVHLTYLKRFKELPKLNISEEIFQELRDVSQIDMKDFFVYRIENEHLHSVRRNVIWDKITRLKQDDFHNSLKAELKKPDTVVSLNEAEWNKILERL